MLCWKITPPMTTEREVAILRVNPKVAVAVAKSPGVTWDCSAISSDWKFIPTLNLAIASITTILTIDI